MGRIVLAAVVMWLGSSCVGAAEPIDLAVMVGLMALRAVSERGVDYTH